MLLPLLYHFPVLAISQISPRIDISSIKAQQSYVGVEGGVHVRKPLNF